jgi:hypothetical protein
MVVDVHQRQVALAGMDHLGLFPVVALGLPRQVVVQALDDRPGLLRPVSHLHLAEQGDVVVVVAGTDAELALPLRGSQVGVGGQFLGLDPGLGVENQAGPVGVHEIAGARSLEALVDLPPDQVGIVGLQQALRPGDLHQLGVLGDEHVRLGGIAGHPVDEALVHVDRFHRDARHLGESLEQGLEQRLGPVGQDADGLAGVGQGGQGQGQEGQARG